MKRSVFKSSVDKLFSSFLVYSWWFLTMCRWAFSLQRCHAHHDWSFLEDLWTFRGRSWVAKRSPWIPLWTRQIFHSPRVEWSLLVDRMLFWLCTHWYTGLLHIFVTVKHFMHNDKYFHLGYWIIEIVCDILVIFYGDWREARAWIHTRIQLCASN